jgi:hypothetical protein
LRLPQLAAGQSLSPADQVAIDIGKVVGDPFPFGVAANRKALDAIVAFAADQQVIAEAFDIDELLVPSTRNL